jgi:hypothetical protein
VKLPFINDKKWPVTKEDDEVRVVNPSHDTQLQDHLIDEVMSAMEASDNRKLKEAVLALIENILNEGDDEGM